MKTLEERRLVSISLALDPYPATPHDDAVNGMQCEIRIGRLKEEEENKEEEEGDGGGGRQGIPDLVNPAGRTQEVARAQTHIMEEEEITSVQPHGTMRCN